MPARPCSPTDDLYARLELPADASSEAIEVAWRALLKRHHPDVAGGGADADERAKRINVAHDWLSRPGASRPLRPRATAPRPGPAVAPRSARPGGGRRRPDGPAAASAGARPLAAGRSTRQEALARHLDRIERLTPDEIDRLTLAETPPIAFVASIARFLSPELLAALEAVERRVHERLPAGGPLEPGVRDSAVGYGQEIVLAAFLDEHLSGDFRERVQERLTRGWSAAVDQPRYGPNGAGRRRRDRGAPRALAAGRAPPDRGRGARPRRGRAADRRGRPASGPTRTMRSASPRSSPVATPMRRARRPDPAGRAALARSGDPRARPPPRVRAGPVRALVGPWRAASAIAAGAASGHPRRHAPAPLTTRVATRPPRRLRWSLVFDGRSGQRPGP